MTTPASEEARARALILFWKNRAEAAEKARDRMHEKRDQWRRVAMALAHEYRKEHGHPPTVDLPPEEE